MSKYSKDFIEEAIARADTTETAVVFEGMAPIVPTWDAFIALIDKEINGRPSNGGQPNEPLKERLINGVLVRNLFYLTVRISDKEFFPEAEDIYKTFGEIFNKEICPVGAFINIVGGEEPGAPHSDERETVFWQCQGESEWTIYETPASKKYLPADLKIDKVINLRPGDVLYLKNGGIHSVKNRAHRASIAFMPCRD